MYIYFKDQLVSYLYFFFIFQYHTFLSIKSYSAQLSVALSTRDYGLLVQVVEYLFEC